MEHGDSGDSGDSVGVNAGDAAEAEVSTMPVAQRQEAAEASGSTQPRMEGTSDAQTAKLVEELLTKAEDLKAAGNAALKEGDVKAALRQYHYAHLSSRMAFLQANPSSFPNMDNAGKASGPLKEKANATHVNILNNLAVCHVKKGNWDRVIDVCTKALEIQPTNRKALLRRSKAYLAKKKLQLCRTDVDAALKTYPTNKEAKALDAELKALESKYTTQAVAELSQNLKRMF